MTYLTELPAWKALQQHHQSLARIHMRELFANQPRRFNDLSAEACDVLVDFSKNRLTQETLHLLYQLANEALLAEQIEAMFNGHAINTTEQRPALHVALRAQTAQPFIVDGKNIVVEIQSTLQKMAVICERIHNKTWLGYTSKAITDIVNIGIGGSDLGPAMAVEALTPYQQTDLRFHFVSNIDAAHISNVLNNLNPYTTLFLVSSKSFTTIETLLNAQTAKQWLLAALQNEQSLKQHFIAITNQPQHAVTFGIHSDNILPVWDWIGGRYSLWSAIGLPIMLAIGTNNFFELLAGAYTMDQHFRYTPFKKNLPVILGLIGIWYYNFFGAQSQAILPYDYHLRHLPMYLQQADMESNGKQVRHDGRQVNYTTGPIIWGTMGCNGQHAYHQLLHQGTHIIPADFIMPIKSHYASSKHQQILFANCLSQTQALMLGKTEHEAMNELQALGYTKQQIEQLVPHKIMPGNNPTNTITFSALTPRNLGALIALYEHKIFVQGSIWGINSFDQWGVELGKQLANRIMPDLTMPQGELKHDSSTNGLIKFYRQITSRVEELQ